MVYVHIEFFKHVQFLSKSINNRTYAVFIFIMCIPQDEFYGQYSVVCFIFYSTLHKLNVLFIVC